MTQLPTPHTRTGRRKCHTGTRKNAPRPCEPSCQITRKICIPPGSQLVCPKILPARIRQRARQLRKRNSHARRDQGKENEAVDNLQGTARVDAGYQGGANAPPAICEGEADAKKGKPGVIAFHLLGVAHLGEVESITVEGLEVHIMIGVSMAHVHVADLFIRHIGGGLFEIVEMETVRGSDCKYGGAGRVLGARVGAVALFCVDCRRARSKR